MRCKEFGIPCGTDLSKVFVALWVRSKLHFYNEYWHFSSKMVKKCKKLVFVTYLCKRSGFVSMLDLVDLELKIGSESFGSRSRSSLKTAEVIFCGNTEIVGNSYFQ